LHTFLEIYFKLEYFVQKNGNDGKTGEISRITIILEAQNGFCDESVQALSAHKGLQ